MHKKNKLSEISEWTNVLIKKNKQKCMTTSESLTRDLEE